MGDMYKLQPLKPYVYNEAVKSVRLLALFSNMQSQPTPSISPTLKQAKEVSGWIFCKLLVSIP